MRRESSQKARSCPVCGRKRSAGSLCELAQLEKSLVRSSRSIIPYPAGQVIFHQGQPPFGMFCLVSGAAKVYKSSPAGGRILLRILGPGEVIGYRGVLSDEPYAATAETIKPSGIRVIPREEVFEYLRASPDLCLSLLAKLARELRISEDQSLMMATEPVRHRIARLLLTTVRVAGEVPTPGCLVPAEYRRIEMAQMLGTAPETLSRALKLMARQKLIRTTRTEIRILDPARLAELADSEVGKPGS